MQKVNYLQEVDDTYLLLWIKCNLNIDLNTDVYLCLLLWGKKKKIFIKNSP